MLAPALLLPLSRCILRSLSSSSSIKEARTESLGIQLLVQLFRLSPESGLLRMAALERAVRLAGILE